MIVIRFALAVFTWISEVPLAIAKYVAIHSVLNVFTRKPFWQTEHRIIHPPYTHFCVIYLKRGFNYSAIEYVLVSAWTL